MKIQELQQKLSEVETDRDYWASKVLKIQQDIDLLNDLLATVSVDRDQLHKQLLEMGAKCERLKGFCNKAWPHVYELVERRESLEQLLSESPSTALTEYMKPVREALLLSFMDLGHAYDCLCSAGKNQESPMMKSLCISRDKCNQCLARLNADGGEKATSDNGS